jgi:hypothetical protein
MSALTHLGRLIVVALFLTATVVHAGDWGLTVGDVKLQSAGPMVFGPEGVLILGDPMAATIWAIDTNDTKPSTGMKSLEVTDFAKVVATAIKAPAEQITVQDLAVNPLSGKIYLGVHVNKKDAHLIRVDQAGTVEVVSLANVKHAKIVLPNPPEDKVVERMGRSRNARLESITDLAYSEGKVLVAGLTKDAAPSNIREIPFPFTTADVGTSVEIYHAAHGRSENNAVVRTFVPFRVNGEPVVLAGFTCTPLVKFPIKDLVNGKSTKGTTVAELGNRNVPLDMITYKQGDQTFLLMANSARGVMKINTAGLDKQPGLTEPVKGGGTAGQAFETVSTLQGVTQLDRLNDQLAVVLIQQPDKPWELRSITLP